MVYPIYLYGHPVLRRKADKISPDYPGLKEFINDMRETMKVSDGIGLAAPQVGKSISLFIVDGSDLAEDDPAMTDFKKVFINAEILEETGDKWVYNEGCLSFPGIHEDISRPSVIRIRYYDEDFVLHEEVFDGMRARIVQHEYDHVQGVLFIDRMAPIRRKMLAGKLNAIARGKVEARYRFVTAAAGKISKSGV